MLVLFKLLIFVHCSVCVKSCKNFLLSYITKTFLVVKMKIFSRKMLIFFLFLLKT